MDAAAGGVDQDASDLAKPLRFEQQFLALPQRLLGLLALGDVDDQHIIALEPAGTVAIGNIGGLDNTGLAGGIAAVASSRARPLAGRWRVPRADCTWASGITSSPPSP